MKNGRKSHTVLLLIGFLAGITNGLLGAAGGIVIVMGLRAFLKPRPTNGRSFYTTALAVMLPLSVLTAIRYAESGHASQISLSFTALPAIAGGLVGALLLPLVRPRLLHRIFAVLILISGVMLAV